MMMGLPEPGEVGDLSLGLPGPAEPMPEGHDGDDTCGINDYSDEDD